MKCILVVEDDNTYRVMLSRLFKHAGYDVVSAENGKEALKLLPQQPVSLILTDIIMPEMEGIQTIMEIRKKYPETRIIAMSGGGRIPSRQYLEMAATLGAQRTFAKPFKTADLLAAVKELIGA